MHTVRVSISLIVMTVDCVYSCVPHITLVILYRLMSLVYTGNFICHTSATFSFLRQISNCNHHHFRTFGYYVSLYRKIWYYFIECSSFFCRVSCLYPSHRPAHSPMQNTAACVRMYRNSGSFRLFSNFI